MSNEENSAVKPAEQTENENAPQARQAEDLPEAAPSGYEIFRRYSVLLETSLTISKMLLLFTAFLAVFLSWLAGADPIWIAARGVIVTLAMGMTLWMANWFFTQRVMDAVLADAKKIEETGPAVPIAVSTVEKRA